MTTLALHQKGRHTYSHDGGLEFFDPGYPTSSYLMQQQPLINEKIWDSYFQGAGYAYQGLDHDLIRHREIESEIRIPPDHGQSEHQLTKPPPLVYF